MKKYFICILILFMAGAFLGATEEEFNQDVSLIDATLGFSEWATPFSVSYEKAINDNVGISGSILYQHWSDDWGLLGDFSSTLIVPSVDALYHFNSIDVKKLDVFAGGGVGFGIYSYSSDYDDIDGAGSSSLFISAVLGVRYYVSEKIAIVLKERYNIIGDWSGSYALLGVTIKL